MEILEGRKRQAAVNFFVGLVLIMIGVLAVTLLGLGFMFRNTALIWVGSVVLGTISVISAVLEKVMIK